MAAAPPPAPASASPWSIDAGAPLDAQAEVFDRLGFCCLRNALTPREVATLREAVERSRADDAASWELRGPGAAGWRPLDAKDGGSAARRQQTAREQEIAVGEAGRYQSATGSLLAFSSEFDAVLTCRPVLRLVDRLMGGRMLCTGVDAMYRAPVPEAPPPGEHAHHQMWHREAGGRFCADDRDVVPSCMPSCQVLFYLTDVGADTHCFSVVPESVAEKRALPVSETEEGGTVGGYDPADMWYTRYRADGVDVHAPAGSAVIQNNVNIHAATIRQSLVPRITLHVNFDSLAGNYGPGWSNSRPSTDAAVKWRADHAAQADAVPVRLHSHPDYGWLFDSTQPRPVELDLGGGEAAKL